jgi:hypothetical protein
MTGQIKPKRKRDKSSPNQYFKAHIKRQKYRPITENKSEPESSSEKFYTPTASEISESESDCDTNLSDMCSRKDLEEIVSKLKQDQRP